ncbi:5-hydroxytryptamine receptor 3C-like [Erinaceus europaeus]|uniref:5-hydroxytryptamine receptor 3C-like n=1 Tax=Erinaceus europaeus TaxID=9365 RepID=A0A1S3AF39_ERIEU|nr:5-hydroxytryptamine receptor 3C-like [Erinaceus europaeus]
MEGGWLAKGGLLLCLTVSFLLSGKAGAFTINCSGFHQNGVDPAGFQAIFDQKDFRPVTNYSIPMRVNISFTLSAILNVDAQLQLLTSFMWLKLTWHNPFISWDPEECGQIKKLSVTIENLWLPDIFIMESMDVDQTPEGLSAYVAHDGQVVYNRPVRVTSICSLDIFYFPFDQQNCTLTFSSFLYTVEHLLLGMDKEVQEMTSTSRRVARTQGEWELLSISKATPKMSVGSSLFDQILFYVAIRRRPSLYVLNLLVPSGFLVAIDALSFYLPAENENRAPFKITLLLGYNVFLLMMNDLLPASGTPLISVYLALCLALMVASLLETIFITYLLHVATTQPPPVPPWLHTLLLCAPRPANCCPTLPYKLAQGPHLPPAQQPGLKEPGKPEEPVRMAPDQQEAELNQGSGSTGVRLADQWVCLCHMTDAFLFRLYLLFLVSSVITVIALWST